MRVALMVGSVLSVVNFLRIGIQYGDWMIALVVSLTMMCTVIMAKVIGGILPLLANALHIDPAIMAAPLITTIVDACSLMIFFGISVALLPV